MKSALWIAAFFAGITGNCDAQKAEYLDSAVLQAHLKDTVYAPKAFVQDHSDSQWAALCCFKYDKLAVPVKGDHAFQDYLVHHVSYPIRALTGNITGRVAYAYDIDTAGRITNVRILKDICGGCGEAVKNAIEHYPDLWVPAMKDGKAVISPMAGTFNFVIESGNRRKGQKRQKHKRD